MYLLSLGWTGFSPGEKSQPVARSANPDLFDELAFFKKKKKTLCFFFANLQKVIVSLWVKIWFQYISDLYKFTMEPRSPFQTQIYLYFRKKC